MNIKDIVKDNTVRFLYYRQGHLYYEVTVPALPEDRFILEKIESVVPLSLKDTNYMFPVPIEDIGDATFNAEHKAITLMRYIRKAIKEGSFVKVMI